MADEGRLKSLNTGSMGGQSIVTVVVPKTRTVESYNPSKLSDSKSIKYSDVQRTFPSELERKASRFSISELARGPLSISEEEEERIQSEIRTRLQVEMDVVREEVKKAAYAEGLAAGKNDARAEVLEQAKPMMENYKKLIQMFESMKTEVFRANEDFLMHVVGQLAKSVILKEIKEDKDYTRRLILNILERVGTKDNIKIFVSQEVFSAANELKQDLAQSLGEIKNITIEVDPEIGDRGCRVDTEFGEIDAEIEVQIASIESLVGKQLG